MPVVKYHLGMADIKGDYAQFYVDGRDAPLLRSTDLSFEEIVAQVVTKGVPFRQAVADACAKIALPHQSGGKKRAWLAENADDIKELGVSADDAYSAFLQGRIDELAYAKERKILEVLVDAVDGDEGDEEDDDEGDEEEEEGDDEGDPKPQPH